MRQKIAEQLRRRVIIRAAEAEAGLLDLLLPEHAAERAGLRKSSGVTEASRAELAFSPPRGIAHAVRDDAAGLRGRGDHIAARTHAEC